MYKKVLIEDGTSRRGQILAQGAFYSGAQCVLKVLDRLAERGDVEELQRVIRRHGRTIRAAGRAAAEAAALRPRSPR